MSTLVTFLYLKQANLLEVVARTLGLESTWFEELFEGSLLKPW